tara:strand:- start:120 stop:611 length:492 start_codon:yes stop_codon:yes gene_type:complete
MNLIVACDKNYGIGIDNSLPNWKIDGDLKRFRELTTGDGNNIVIMGRNTFESLPNGPLKNRLNIVISRKYSEIEFAKQIQSSIKCFKSLEDAFKFSIDYTKDSGEIWVIGGSQIYEESVKLKLINKFFITKLKDEYKCDTFLGPLTIDYINNNSDNIVQFEVY